MTSLGFTKLIVDDLERQAAFYSALYEFQQLHRIKAEIGGTMIDEIVLGTADEALPLLVLFKYLDGRKTVTGEVILGFMTNNLDGAIERAVACGGAVDVEPFQSDVAAGRVAFIRDPEGHLVEILEIA